MGNSHIPVIFLLLLLLVLVYIYRIESGDTEISPKGNSDNKIYFPPIESQSSVETQKPCPTLNTQPAGNCEIIDHTLPIKLKDKPGNHYWFDSEIIPNQKYAVFGANIPELGEKHQTIKYYFTLPLIIDSWNRIGFGSVVIIPGSLKTLEENPLLQVTLNHMKFQRENNKFPVVILFIETPHHYAVGVGQLSRIFLTNYLLEHKEALADTYFITSDADLMPIRGYLYELHRSYDAIAVNPYHADILSPRLNVALSCIGARMSTWQKMINFSDCPKDKKYVQDVRYKM